MKHHAFIRTAVLAILGVACTSHAAVNVQVNPDGTRFAAVRFSGDTAVKYDIVFVGDGFTSMQQTTFNQRVNDAVSALQAIAPYSERMCAFNIWRVNVVSTESGVDHPVGNITRNTELDCRYGNPVNGEAERCITSDSPAKCYEAADFAPDYDAVFVLVNDTQWGGCAGALVFSSISPGFADIITHELGHKVGGLADEYDCYICDGSDSGLSYSGPEPGDVNLTIQTNRNLIKWGDLILATTPLPTTVNNPPGVVGLWEGGGYRATNIYRPQSTCHMRTTGSDFCAVCERHMRKTLSFKCTDCEIDPNSIACMISRFDEDILVNWPCDLIWPIPLCPNCPVCLNCPFDEMFFEDIIYTVRGVPEDAVVEVLDDRGQVVAEGHRSGDERQALQASFKAQRDTQYFIKVKSGAANPNVQSREINLKNSLMRNGVEQRLGAGR